MHSLISSEEEPCLQNLLQRSSQKQAAMSLGPLSQKAWQSAKQSLPVERHDIQLQATSPKLPTWRLLAHAKYQNQSAYKLNLLLPAYPGYDQKEFPVSFSYHQVSSPIFGSDLIAHPDINALDSHTHTHPCCARLSTDLRTGAGWE